MGHRCDGCGRGIDSRRMCARCRMDRHCVQRLRDKGYTVQMPLPFRQSNPVTSKLAAIRARDTARSHREMILEALEAVGEEGMTHDQLDQVLGLRPGSANRRLTGRGGTRGRWAGRADEADARDAVGLSGERVRHQGGEMRATGYWAGHAIEWDEGTRTWRYMDDGQPVPSYGGNDRPCKKCRLSPVACRVYISPELSHTGEGRWDWKPVDACIAGIVDALNAAGIVTRHSCCGHGKGRGKIGLQDGRTILIEP